MVLQRWQTVFLFLAAIAMAVFTFMPVMGLVTDQGNFTLCALGCCESSVPNYLLLTLDCLIVVMLLVTIFKYRDLKLQQRLCKIDILLIIALVFLGAIIFAGAKHHFFTFLTIGGLAYAILSEAVEEIKEEQ